MAKRPFTAIVPTVFETQLTGLIGAGERTIRGHVWRVEWRSGKPASFLRDGVPQDKECWRTNPSVANLMTDSHAFFCSSRVA